MKKKIETVSCCGYSVEVGATCSRCGQVAAGGPPPTLDEILRRVVLNYYYGRREDRGYSVQSLSTRGSWEKRYEIRSGGQLVARARYTHKGPGKGSVILDIS
jgi:hypothetical protein